MLDGDESSHPLQEAVREAEEARRAAVDAAAGQAAALAATKRRADTYREENRALLANYDDWLRTLVSAKNGQPGGLAPPQLCGGGGHLTA